MKRLLVLVIMIVSILLLQAAAVSAQTFDFDWSIDGWSPTGLGAMPRNHTNVAGSGVDIQISVSGDTNNFISNTPNVNDDSGNLADDSLNLAVNYDDKSDNVIITFTFSSAVHILDGITIKDIDRSTDPPSSYQDSVRVLGKSGPTLIYPSDITFEGPTNLVLGGDGHDIQSVTGNGLNSGDPRGQATVYFSSDYNGDPIDTLTIKYKGGNGGGSSNPGQQSIWIGDIRGLSIPTYDISGNITGATSVTVDLTGDSTDQTTTDGSGNYSFTGLANGSYSVTPSKSGYLFSPPSHSYSDLNSDQTNRDFTASPQQHIIIENQLDPVGSAENFEFNPSYGSNFLLSNGETHDSGPLTPGVYSVSEVNIPAGWNLANVICSDGSDPGAIDLSQDETCTCTFYNESTSISHYIDNTEEYLYTGAVKADLNVTALTTPGTVTISVHPDEYYPGTDNTNSVKRWFDIDGGSASGTFTLTLRYMDSELNGLLESENFCLWRNSSGWQSYTGTFNAANNSIKVEGVTGFSDWIIGNNPIQPPVPEIITIILLGLGLLSLGGFIWFRKKNHSLAVS